MPCRSRDTLLVHLVKFDGDLHAAPTLPHSARTSHPSVGRSISEKQGAMHCAHRAATISTVAARPPSQDLERHGCRVSSYRLQCICPAMRRAQGPAATLHISIGATGGSTSTAEVVWVAQPAKTHFECVPQQGRERVATPRSRRAIPSRRLVPIAR